MKKKTVITQFDVQKASSTPSPWCTSMSIFRTRLWLLSNSRWQEQCHWHNKTHSPLIFYVMETTTPIHNNIDAAVVEFNICIDTSSCRNIKENSNLPSKLGQSFSPNLKSANAQFYQSNLRFLEWWRSNLFEMSNIFSRMKCRHLSVSWRCGS